MRWRDFIFLLFGCTIIWCFIFEIFILKSISGEFFNYFQNYETPLYLKNLFIKAPILEERLFLIDRNMLHFYYKLESKNRSAGSSCVFCKIRKNQPITFALLCPTNTSLEVSNGEQRDEKSKLEREINNNILLRSTFSCLY